MTLQRFGAPLSDLKRHKNRRTALMVALATEGMRRVGSCGLWLEGKGHAAVPDVLKLVAFLLAIPCFKVADALFQFTYSLQQRRLSLLGRECVLLGGEDYSLEFKDLPLNLHRPLYVHERLRQIARRLQAGECTGNRLQFIHEARLLGIDLR